MIMVNAEKIGRCTMSVRAKNNRAIIAPCRVTVSKENTAALGFIKHSVMSVTRIVANNTNMK